jgi:hypothetical protein
MIPRRTTLRPTDPTIPLLIHGQGVFLFTVPPTESACFFRILNKDDTQGLLVHWTPTSVHVTNIQTNEPLLDPKNTKGLTTHKGAFYWVSLDAQNQRIQAGVGEARIETVIYTYQFPTALHASNKAFLESLHHITCCSATLQPQSLLRDPITSRTPLQVRRSHELTMEDVATGAYLPKAHLSAVAQTLYDCIGWKAFALDDPSFPDFSKAIERSIATPGLWCYEKLKAKAGEFGKPNPLETYLRITLNENNGESPGIPYVMEIWPVGHFSPIHSHSAANAVIRVLHGSIHVKLFPHLCNEGVAPFAETDFHKGQITWISPTLNQTHQLKNLETNKNTCITIQCYMYDAADTAHYDYFDYIDADGNKQQYEPDSDMGFMAFKQLMKDEWVTRPRTSWWCC